MNSSTHNPKMKAIVAMPVNPRHRHVPVYAYFAQIFSKDLNRRLFELLNFDSSTSEESRRCKGGQSITVWSLTEAQVKILYESNAQQQFEIWESKDGDDLVNVTIKLRRKLFNQIISRGARIKKASEVRQRKTAYTEDELEKFGVHVKRGSGGVGFVLYRITGSGIGEMDTQIGYGATLDLAISNARENGHWHLAQWQARLRAIKKAKKSTP